MVATGLEDERFRKINTEMTPRQRLGRVERALTSEWVER